MARFLTVALTVLAIQVSLVASNQTASVSPVVIHGDLPYDLELRPYGMALGVAPTLQSFAKGQFDGKWVFVGGRTNGLHDITKTGLDSFPPAHQNRDIWVIDPIGQQVWHRPLDDATSGLTAHQVDALSTTNSQFYQDGSRLYMSGGYGSVHSGGFRTFDTLTAIDLPGIIDWAQSNDNESASNHVRQINDPLFQVAGGAMERIGNRTHLVFGQDFHGGYTPNKNGTYSQQVRSFHVTDNGTELGISDVQLSDPTDDQRRRDLNVAPILGRDATGQLEEKLVALSGVFTPTNGAWTVPIEIDENGIPMMADPSDPDTFKQGMNNYHSAKLSLYSETSDEMHLLLFGGISLQYYDRNTDEIVTDEQLPFVNQITAVAIDSEGRYTQTLLPSEFPLVFDDSGNPLRFGAGAEFLVADGTSTFENGVIRWDELQPDQTIGFIYGGIASDQGHAGNTAASNLIFEVVYRPVPEPRTLDLLLVVAAVTLVVWFATHIRNRRFA